MILGMVLLAIELPLPALKKLAIRRSFVVRVVLLLFQVFLNILYYQVRCHQPTLFHPIYINVYLQGTNAAIWSLVAAGCYTRAIVRGEFMAEAKGNRGRGGDA